MKLRMLVMLVFTSLLNVPVIALDTSHEIVNPQKPVPITDSLSKIDPEKLQQNGEVLAWLIVLNKNEIAAANETMRHSIDSAVKKYAQLMRSDHTANLNETKRLSQTIHIKPVVTDNVKSTESEGNKIINTLKPIKDSKLYETTYIEFMVNGHTNALKAIDDYLLNQNLTPRVLTHLKMTKSTVQRHLDKAKEIQDKLNASSSNTTSAN